MSIEKPFFFAPAIAVLGLLFFVPALVTVADNSFLNDDLEIIHNGVKGYQDPGSLFRPDHSGGMHVTVYLLLGALFQVFGEHAFPYYAFLLAMHAVLFLLLIRTGLALGLTRAGALVSGSVFLAAGFHFQSIAWIGNYPRILMILFLMASLSLFIAFRKRGGRAGLFFSLILWIAALLCNEDAIVFPFLLMIYDFLFGRRGGRKETNSLANRFLAGMAVMAVLYGVLEFTVYSGRTAVYTARNFQGIQKLAGLLWTFGNLLVPRREILVFWTEPSPAARLLIPAALYLPLLWLAVRALANRPRENPGLARMTLFSGLWFLVAFAPFSLRAPGAWMEYPQPRYLYLPFMGAALFIGKFWDRIQDWARRLPVPRGTFCRAWMLLAFFYFYILNVSTFCFMADKLDREAGSQDRSRLAGESSKS